LLFLGDLICHPEKLLGKIKKKGYDDWKFSEPVIPKYLAPADREERYGKRARAWLGTAIPPGLGKERIMKLAEATANRSRNQGLLFCSPVPGPRLIRF